ncbi:MAG: hypothetical protein LJE64_07665 [Desulfofustis sp.]|jgi:hypothetical protein|nr:hypothetical protein [Desulfofustis sp.]
MRIDRPIHEGFFRSRPLRFAILGLMVVAFMFGFADQLVNLNFERLHIFFFNLCAGGFIILYHTENTARPSFRCYGFLALSLIYALLAFAKLYPAAALISLTLGLLVEWIRIRSFSLVPRELFDQQVSVVDKFHHASVLCLSLGLFIATFVLLNDTSLHWLPYKNLTLDVFFLGYSFPVSLITMSVMFSFIRRDIGQPLRYVKQGFFWTINVGVIIFFLFIVFDMRIAKFTIATILFITVVLIFSFFLLLGRNLQQKYFLLSGMSFLVFTGITGIFYIEIANYADVYARWGRLLLSSHSYLSLYGWGLSGLLILIRWNDFPLKLNSWLVILFHWTVIGILAPLGKTSPLIAVAAIVAYCLFLHFFFREESGGKLADNGIATGV